jgi:hypothetical protein
MLRIKLYLIPFFAYLTISSVTAAELKVTHLGAFLLYGKAEAEIPLPFPLDYMRPINVYFVFNKNF